MGARAEISRKRGTFLWLYGSSCFADRSAVIGMYPNLSDPRKHNDSLLGLMYVYNTRHDSLFAYGRWR